MWFLSFVRRHVCVRGGGCTSLNLSVTFVSAQAKPYRLRINHTYNDKVPLSAVLIENKWDAGCPPTPNPNLPCVELLTSMGLFSPARAVLRRQPLQRPRGHSSLFTQLRIDHVSDGKHQVPLMCTSRKAHFHQAKWMSHFRCPPICQAGGYIEKTIFLSSQILLLVIT